jgi:hypothetical protein
MTTVPIATKLCAYPTDLEGWVTGIIAIQKTPAELKALSSSERRDLYNNAFSHLAEKFEESVANGFSR